MKKLSVFLVVALIVILMNFVSINEVYAHSIELDPDSLISFPWTIYDGKGTITISSSQSGYELYYQSVEVSNSSYAQIEKINDDGKAELETIKTKINELKAECNNLKAIYEEANEEYKSLVQNSDDAEKIEEAKEKAQTAATNYNNKIDEHNLKVEEYNTKVTEINNKIKELTPSFVESKWIKTEDRSFNIDLSQFSGEQVFVVWAKLVSSNGTISYDQIFYTMSGTKPETVKVTSVSLDKEEVTIKQGSSYTLVATVNPENATDKTVTWKSSDEKIVTVSNGKVTAIAEGTAIITVTTNEGSYTDTCKVTVAKKIVEENKEKEDNTVATGKIPQTGTFAYILIFVIILMSVIGFIGYKKVKYLNFK